METIQGTVIIDNSIKNSKNEAMIEQLSTVSEDFYQVDDVTIAPDSSVVDCTQDMETDESVKSLLDQEQDSTNLFEQEGQGTLSTESISAEKDETAFHQDNINLVKDNGVLHQDNGVLHQDNGVLHQDNGVLHQDNGVLHQDNGVLHQDNGVLHQDNGVLHQDNGVLHQDNGVLHQDNGVLHQDNGVLHQDNGVLHQDNGVLHQDNGVLHQDNGVLHQDNGVLHQDNGVLHQDNGVLHQDNGVPLNENSVLHQDKINMQDKVSIVNDTVLIHDTGLTQDDEYGRNLILGHQDLGSINQTNLLSREKRAECGEVRTKLTGGMQISQDSGTVTTDCPKQQQECSGCKKSIIDRFLLKAMDQYWHEDCLKCSCCDCRLGEVGSTLFAKANLLLCRRDYLRLFGTTGYCSACSKMIPAFEMVMRAKNNVYHLECFACQMCNHRFCVGDKFYLCDNKILCEYDYEERMVFANMTYNYNALSQIKRQTNSLSDDLSSGYGSPSPGSL